MSCTKKSMERGCNCFLKCFNEEEAATKLENEDLQDLERHFHTMQGGAGFFSLEVIESLAADGLALTREFKTSRDPILFDDIKKTYVKLKQYDFNE